MTNSFETTRYYEIGSNFFYVPALYDNIKDKTEYTVEAYYLSHATTAYYYTAQTLEDLEKSSIHLNSGRASNAAIATWFLCIEAFINGLLKLNCMLHDEDFQLVKSKRLMDKVRYLLDVFGISKHTLYQNTNIINRLKEFLEFRNNLFHDRYYKEELNFRHTAFSKNPYYVNQLDVMEGAKLSHEIFQFFRYLIPNMDLMPDILIPKDDAYGFLKFDFLYKKILSPLFLLSVRKHGYTLTFDPKVQIAPCEQSPRLVPKQINMIVKAKPGPGEIIPRASTKKTEYSQKLLKRAQRKIHIGPDTFKTSNQRRT